MLTPHSVTPADGGKVQAWSWDTFHNCQSINAHQDAVTSIQVGGSLTCRCMSADAEGFFFVSHIQTIFKKADTETGQRFLLLSEEGFIINLFLRKKKPLLGNQTHSHPHTRYSCLLLSKGNQRYLLRCKLWSSANFRELTVHIILSERAFYGY